MWIWLIIRKIWELKKKDGFSTNCGFDCNDNITAKRKMMGFDQVVDLTFLHVICPWETEEKRWVSSEMWSWFIMTEKKGVGTNCGFDL